MPPSPLGTREHLERSRRAGDEGIDLNLSHSRTHRLNIFPHPAPSPGGRGKIPLPSPQGEGFTDPLAGTLKGYSYMLRTQDIRVGRNPWSFKLPAPSRSSLPDLPAVPWTSSGPV